MTTIPIAPAANAPVPAGGAATAPFTEGDGPVIAEAFAALIDAISKEFVADEDAAGVESVETNGLLDGQAEDEDTAVDEMTRSASMAVLVPASPIAPPTAANASSTPALDASSAVGGPDSSTDGAGDLSALLDVDAEPSPIDAPAGEEADFAGDSDIEVPADPDVGIDDVETETETETEPGADSETSTETVAPSDGVSADVEGDAPTDDGVDPPPTLPDRPTTAIPAAGPDGAGNPGTGTAPTFAPVTAVDGPTAAASSSRPLPALPDQLVSVLTPLRSGPDGTHRMSLQLRPDELGTVMIEVRVKGNEISLNVRTDLAGTADLVRASLGDLRTQLEGAGFTAGGLDVAERGPDGTADDGTGDHADAPGSDRNHLPAASADGAPTDLPTAMSGLDLRL